jgi:hypothetical protein
MPSNEPQTPGYQIAVNTSGIVPIRKAAGRKRFNFWILIAFHVLPAAAIVLALQRIPRLHQWQGWILLAGMFVSVASYHFVVRWIACTSRRRHAVDAQACVRERIDQSLLHQGVPVGFAPGPSPRFFVTSYNWDNGMLFLTAEKFAFVGEHTSFALTRDQIRTVMPGNGSPGWMKSPRVYFSWEDKQSGKYGTFNITPLEQKNWFSHPTEVRSFYLRVRAWRNRSHAAEAAVGQELGPPEIGTVTSMSPKEINKFSRWVNLTTMIVGLAWGFSVVMGAGHGGYICLTALVLRFYESLPYWFYRERTYVFDPVRQAKHVDATPQAVAAVEPLLTTR